jgi:hypothetical protein
LLQLSSKEKSIKQRNAQGRKTMTRVTAHVLTCCNFLFRWPRLKGIIFIYLTSNQGKGFAKMAELRTLSLHNSQFYTIPTMVGGKKARKGNCGET